MAVGDAVVRCLGEKAKDVSGGYLTKSRELAVKTLCIFVLAFAVLYVSTPEAQFSLDGARDEAVASGAIVEDRKSTRLNSSHRCISYAVFCLKKKKKKR